MSKVIYASKKMRIVKPEEPSASYLMETKSKNCPADSFDVATTVSEGHATMQVVFGIMMADSFDTIYLDSQAVSTLANVYSERLMEEVNNDLFDSAISAIADGQFLNPFIEIKDAVSVSWASLSPEKIDTSTIDQKPPEEMRQVDVKPLHQRGVKEPAKKEDTDADPLAMFYSIPKNDFIRKKYAEMEPMGFARNILGPLANLDSVIRMATKIRKNQLSIIAGDEAHAMTKSRAIADSVCGIVSHSFPSWEEMRKRGGEIKRQLAADSFDEKAKEAKETRSDSDIIKSLNTEIVGLKNFHSSELDKLKSKISTLENQLRNERGLSCCMLVVIGFMAAYSFFVK